jgi:hypothetical protein
LKHRENEIARELILQILDVTFGRTGAERLLLEAIEFFFLPNVRAESDDLGVIRLPQPPQND